MLCGGVALAGLGLLGVVCFFDDPSSRATRNEDPMRNMNDASTKFVVLGGNQDHGIFARICLFRPIVSLRILLQRGMFTGTSRRWAMHLHCLKRDVALGVAVLDLTGSALTRAGRQWRPLCRMSHARVRLG